MGYVRDVNVALAVSLSLLFELFCNDLLLSQLFTLLSGCCLELIDRQVFRFISSIVNHDTVFKGLLRILKSL